MIRTVLYRVKYWGLLVEFLNLSIKVTFIWYIVSGYWFAIPSSGSYTAKSSHRLDYYKDREQRRKFRLTERIRINTKGQIKRIEKHTNNTQQKLTTIHTNNKHAHQKNSFINTASKNHNRIEFFQFDWDKWID